MFLLIHGAWHGAWVWRRLALAGAVTPDLDLSQGATLTGHAEAIAELARSAAAPVVLAGHSYGAAVAQLVAARAPARVRGLVALDGFLLRPGQSILDLIPPTIRARWQAEELVPPLPLDVMAIPPADREWLSDRLRPQPLASFTEPYPQLPPFTGPRLYIRASGFAFSPFDRIFARCAREGWHRETIPTGHDIMLSEPEWLARRLRAFAGSSAGG